MAKVTITCGGKIVVVDTFKIHMSSYPGCIIPTGGDLFDLGFTVKEIDEHGITMQIVGEVELLFDPERFKDR